MTTRRPRKKTRTLTDLGALVEHMPKAKAGPPRSESQGSDSGQTGLKSDDQETDLFARAMADVTPMRSDVYWQIPKNRRSKKAAAPEDDASLKALQRLIDKGEGFRVADTPEYMEAAGPGVDRSLIRRLHQGRYAVEGHVDLHGLTSTEAEQVLARFVSEALASGKRMVLIIHGRGLTSPGPPVLKHMVYNWLTRGPLRRHVLALTSARPCDGGAGATYVLLRKKPWAKRKKRTR